MSTKFQNKYRIESARLKNWDYGSNAVYFVTICTHERQHYFGKINNKEMCLSKIGKIAKIEWYKTLEIRPDMNLQLNAFVVMPNHVHGIIVIGKNEYNDGALDRDAMHRVSTIPLQPTNSPQYTNKFAPQSKNLASIIRGYKSSITKQARILNIEFDWQPRFHDHIIRNQKSYDNIRNYIINNPKNWKEDKFFL